jgi:hypothetical protein
VRDDCSRRERPNREVDVPIAAAAGRTITTVEGLGSREHAGVLQRAFIEERDPSRDAAEPLPLWNSLQDLPRGPGEASGHGRAHLEPRHARLMAPGGVLVSRRAVDRPGQPFLGTGEAAQGPTAAALANALADAVGVRVRQLPLGGDRVKAAMAS